MKKLNVIVGLFLLLGICLSFIPEKTNATEIEWLTFEQAIEKSKIEPRPIFVDVYTDWCGWCKKMDRDTFQNPKVVAYMNKQYYCIKYNAEGREDVVFPNKTYKSNGKTHDLALELLDRQMSYPSVVYMDKTFAKIQAVPGYRAPDEFLKITKFMGEEIYKKQTWQHYDTTYVE